VEVAQSMAVVAGWSGEREGWQVSRRVGGKGPGWLSVWGGGCEPQAEGEGGGVM
jgi:hypothetical protein